MFDFEDELLDETLDEDEDEVEELFLLPDSVPPAQPVSSIAAVRKAAGKIFLIFILCCLR